MTAHLLILRPQPGADETAARARAQGLDPVVAPLFSIRPLDWEVPNASAFEAVLLTSANAARRGGLGLTSFLRLPCYAVGEATQRTAEEAGFIDIRTGPSDAAALLDLMAADGITRALHPCGEDRVPLHKQGIEIVDVPVYAADLADELSPEAETALAEGAVAMLHSPRAAELFAARAARWRDRTLIAAISPATARAAGLGWREVAVAPVPRDEALLELALRLCQRSEAQGGAGRVMSDGSGGHTIGERRAGIGGVALLLLLAFLIGGGATAWALNQWLGWGQPAPPPAEAAPERAPPPAPAPAPTAAPPTAIAVPATGPDLGNGLAPAVAPERIVIDPETSRRVGELEQRVAQINLETRFAAGNADRAEGLLVAFAVRRALDRGVGLGYLEGLLRERFGESQPQAVALIIDAARNPVTLQELQDGLQDLAPQLAGVGPEASWWDALQFEFANLVNVRRQGTPPNDPQERVNRALRRLEAGQVDVALAEILRIPARERARDWALKARRYVTSRRALDAIENAVLAEPTPAPVAPAPQPAQPIAATPAPQRPAARR